MTQGRTYDNSSGPINKYEETYAVRAKRSVKYKETHAVEVKRSVEYHTKVDTRVT